MTDPQQALIAQWRAKANGYRRGFMETPIGPPSACAERIADIFERVADQLESLASVPVTERYTCGPEGNAVLDDGPLREGVPDVAPTGIRTASPSEPNREAVQAGYACACDTCGRRAFLIRSTCARCDPWLHDAFEAFVRAQAADAPPVPTKE
jgi:hypothetical protein